LPAASICTKPSSWPRFEAYSACRTSSKKLRVLDGQLGGVPLEGPEPHAAPAGGQGAGELGSVMPVSGTPSSARLPVKVPVPFWPAVHDDVHERHPVSASTCLSTSAVISMM
jgi:hypothetical protein